MTPRCRLLGRPDTTFPSMGERLVPSVSQKLSTVWHAINHRSFLKVQEKYSDRAKTQFLRKGQDPVLQLILDSICGVSAYHGPSGVISFQSNLRDFGGSIDCSYFINATQRSSISAHDLVDYDD